MLARLGAGRRRAKAMAALGLDEGAARELAEELALEAELLSRAPQVTSDGPSWDEGLALGARLAGVWMEEAARATRARNGRRR
jgi:hypothetical protein